MNVQGTSHCNHALRPSIPTENLSFAQEAAMTSLGTSKNTLKLKKRPVGMESRLADTLPNDHFHRERLATSVPQACSSPAFVKQVESTQTLPPPYQTKSSSVRTQRISLPKHSALDQARSEASTLNDDSKLALQPETRAISQEQLAAEVKGIYAGLVMVEAKCLEVDSQRAAAGQDISNQQHGLSQEQWQALIALHWTLLHEHHDFFLASEHPCASPALRCLAAKYSMPVRMWRHGIHGFLELLRHRLSDSLEHMLAFIYLAYSMIAVLYEAVPTFEDTWVECLGDLGRYRMAIEDDDIRNREVWTGVSRFWYSKAAGKSPTVGRLYHHLAILARPSVMQQWSLYARALTGCLCFEEEAPARRKNEGPFGATGRKIQFPLSVLRRPMLRTGFCLGITACSLLALPYRRLPNHLATRLLYLLLIPCALGYATARIGAIASGYTITFASKSNPSTKGVRNTAKTCAPEHKRKPVQKLQQPREPAPATSYVSSTDIALERVDVAGTEVAGAPEVTDRLSRRLRATVTRACTLFCGPSLSGQSIEPSRTCRLALFLLSMHRVSAAAVLPEDSGSVASISNSATGRLTTAKPIRTDFSTPTVSEWSFLILCATILAICWLVARLKRWELLKVLGTCAGIDWYLWLYLTTRYPDISPWYPWSIWSMGTIVLLHFIRLGFQENVLFLSSVTAVPVTMGAVSYCPDLRGDHLTPFPVCLNVSLGFWIFAVPVLTRKGDSLFHHACHLWDFLGRHIRRVTRRLRLPWHPEDELPLHRRD